MALLSRAFNISLTTLLAALALASALSPASARNLSISNQNIRITWSALEFVAAIANVRCAVTLEGSFHARTITKAPRALLGYITRALTNQSTCRETAFGTAARLVFWNGTETLLGRTIGQSLPWHITYEGFSGTLPNLTGVELLLRNIKVSLELPLRGCLATYGGPGANIKMSGAISGGIVGQLRPGTETIALTESASAGNCINAAGLTGSGTVTLLGNTTRIAITLI